MNQPRCQCFCQPSAPANFGFKPPRQMNAFQNPPASPNFAFQPPRQANAFQNPPATSPRFLTNPFSQVEGPLFVKKSSDRRNSIRLAFDVNQPKEKELFVKPGSESSVTENTQGNENPLFLRRSDRRNAIRMNINVNQPESSELFVSPSETSSDQTQTTNSLARALDLGIALFV